MQDFYHLVKSALQYEHQNVRLISMGLFLKRWNADPRINVDCDEKPVCIEIAAFLRSISGKNSLEGIFASSRRLDREIAFAGILVGDRIKEFIRGKIGDQGLCDWNAGKLMDRARTAAKKHDGKILLGHTHPEFFGAICSAVYWTKRDLEKFTDPISRLMLQSGFYKRFGGDYAEMVMRSIMPDMSTYFMILSPRENQIGVFEIQDGGKVVYHPVCIVL